MLPSLRYLYAGFYLHPLVDSHSQGGGAKDSPKRTGELETYLQPERREQLFNGTRSLTEYQFSMP